MHVYLFSARRTCQRLAVALAAEVVEGRVRFEEAHEQVELQPCTSTYIVHDSHEVQRLAVALAAEVVGVGVHLQEAHERVELRHAVLQRSS